MSDKKPEKTPEHDPEAKKTPVKPAKDEEEVKEPALKRKKVDHDKD